MAREQLGWICDKCKDAIRKGRGHVCICKYTGQLPNVWFEPAFSPCDECEWKPYSEQLSKEEWLNKAFEERFPEEAKDWRIVLTPMPDIFNSPLIIRDDDAALKLIKAATNAEDSKYPAKRHCYNCRYNRKKGTLTKMSARCSKCIMETPYSKSAPGRYPLWAKQTEAQRKSNE